MWGLVAPAFKFSGTSHFCLPCLAYCYATDSCHHWSALARSYYDISHRNAWMTIRPRNRMFVYTLRYRVNRCTRLNSSLVCDYVPWEHHDHDRRHTWMNHILILRSIGDLFDMAHLGHVTILQMTLEQAWKMLILKHFMKLLLKKQS